MGALCHTHTFSCMRRLTFLFIFSFFIANDRRFWLVPILWIPAQLASLIYVCYKFSYNSFDLLETVGLILSFATQGGVGINVGHELGHRHASPWYEHQLANIPLACGLYSHFNIEHNQGHHLRVATVEDPASSRFNETFWEFLPRTVCGSFRSAWEICARKQLRRQRPIIAASNPMVWHAITPFLLSAIIALIGGLAPMLFFISQGIGSFVLLEVVNYVEHYGLVRLKRTVHDRTSYEPVKARHSWNNSASFSQLLLFKLNRHSDHHEHSNLRYHILRTVDEAPQLPCGYPAAMILALFPPLWMAIMNPRVPDINKSKELLEWEQEQGEGCYGAIIPVIQRQLTTLLAVYYAAEQFVRTMA